MSSIEDAAGSTAAPPNYSEQGLLHAALRQDFYSFVRKVFETVSPGDTFSPNWSVEAVAYALGALEERGVLFLGPQAKVYEGMIIGENAKPEDLEVNPLKAKQLTNFRSTGKDDAIRLTPPRQLSLEQAIAWIDDDEMVEVTPKSIRLRKAILDPHERKKARRKDAA